MHDRHLRRRNLYTAIGTGLATAFFALDKAFSGFTSDPEVYSAFAASLGSAIAFGGVMYHQMCALDYRAGAAILNHHLKKRFNEFFDGGKRFLGIRRKHAELSMDHTVPIVVNAPEGYTGPTGIRSTYS